MARKDKKEAQELNYAALVRELKQQGPERLYLIWGPETYLREQFMQELKRRCLPEGEEAFNYLRIDGPEPDIGRIRQAVDALPFMGDYCLVELRGLDVDKYSQGQELEKILSDISEQTVVAIVLDSGKEPDGRTKLVKALRKLGRELKFTGQSQGRLTDWIVRRFAAAGKRIELDAAQRLIFLSDGYMNSLIPEIDKIAAYTKGELVTMAEVDAVASRTPQADIFQLSELIGTKKYNSAMSLLAELMMDKKNEPIVMLALLGAQMRRLYAARIALDQGLGGSFVKETCGIKYDFIIGKLTSAARGYSLGQLARAVELCAQGDYRMKSSGGDSGDVFKETVLRIAAIDQNA